MAPIYPTAGVGAIVTWSDGTWLNRTDLFQADPRERGTAFERGFLLLDEVNFLTAAATAYKVGLWRYRPHDLPAAVPTGDSAALQRQDPRTEAVRLTRRKLSQAWFH